MIGSPLGRRYNRVGGPHPICYWDSHGWINVPGAAVRIVVNPKGQALGD
jgi:hypothetical protein